MKTTLSARLSFGTAFLLAVLFFPSLAKAEQGKCLNGYDYQPHRGIDCVQKNCDKVTHAHLGSTGHCVCGTSGSIHENPKKDPNQECKYSAKYTACPGCVYACVGIKDACPDPPKKDPGREIKKDDKKTASGDIKKAEVKSPGKTCQQECDKLKLHGKYDEVLKVEGKYPNCKCTVDNKDEHNRLIQTVQQDGDKRTIYTFNPETGDMVKKETVSIQAEKERIRQKLGYKYSEEEIDKLLSEEKIKKWFDDQTSDIKTDADMATLTYWWQHFVAIMDHGYGNNPDFVDTYKFGRCGDSMQWMERNLAKELKLTGKSDKKSEAILSITGEKYGNLLNHTALIIRPTGYSNIEWADTVNTLLSKTQKNGLSKDDIQSIDPRLLKAKVLDPYFKKETTVEEFIKGWSVIKIS